MSDWLDELDRLEREATAWKEKARKGSGRADLAASYVIQANSYSRALCEGLVAHARELIDAKREVERLRELLEEWVGENRDTFPQDLVRRSEEALKDD